MLSAIDPKFKTWTKVRNELKKIVSCEDHGGKNESSTCLTHGFQHHTTFETSENIRCIAHRTTFAREEFIFNHGNGSNNVLHLKSFRRDRNSSEEHTSSNRFHSQFAVKCAYLQHLVWVSKHRVFVAIDSEKNLRVFSDTLHRCQPLAGPTCCAIPVLEMTYLEDTNEIVTAGIGVIIPWKIKISNVSDKTNGKRNKSSENGRQILEASEPYPCALRRNDWVVAMRVYRGRSGGGSFGGGKQNLLVVTCVEAIVAIDYVKRQQVNFCLITTLRGHRYAIAGLQVNKDNTSMVSCSLDGAVRVWCLETFKETQCFHIGRSIRKMWIGSDPQFLFFFGKLQIFVYRRSSVHSLYSVLHSNPVKLVRGSERSIRSEYDDTSVAKIIAPMEDGSISLLCPLTGVVITTLYPMTTLQIFSDVLCDPYTDLMYVRLNSGSIMQCNCTSNPSNPLQCFTPTEPFDEFVFSISLIRAKLDDHTSLSIVMAGLRNGQITVVYPNLLRMPITQAHTGTVLFMQALPINHVSEQRDADKDEATVYDSLVSIGKSTVRTWDIKIVKINEEDERGTRKEDVAKWNVTLIPISKVLLSMNIPRLNFFLAMSDRVVLVSDDNHVYVMRTNNAQPPATSQMVYIHHRDEDHTGDIVAADCSMLIRLFVTASEDGMVKVWDDENRLIREISFDPHRLLSVCFANGRDLLVGMEGRIYSVNCQTFLTKQIIVEKKLTEMSFEDDRIQPAITYDENKQFESNIDKLPMVPLAAHERQCHLDDGFGNTWSQSPEHRAKYDTAGLMLTNNQAFQFFHDIYRRQKITKRLKTNTSEKKIGDDKDGEVVSKWKLMMIGVMRKIRLRSKSIYHGHVTYDFKTFNALRKKNLVKEERRKSCVEEYGLDYDDTNVVISCERCRDCNGDASKLTVDSGISLSESDQQIISRKFRVAPDGFVPNSTIRKEVNPPPTPPHLKPEEFRLRMLPLPEESIEKVESSIPSIESDLTSFDSGQIKELNWDSDEGILLSDDLMELSDSLDFTGSESCSDEEFYEDEMEEKPNMQYGAQGLALRLLKKDQRGEGAMSFKRERRRNRSQKRQKFQPENVRENSGTTHYNKAVEEVSAAQPPPPLPKPKIDMKAKLMQQREEISTTKRKVVILPKLLKEITEAMWFRTKLDVVNAEAVAAELIRMGLTTRKFAHKMSCSYLTKITLAFGAGGLETGRFANTLSKQTIEKIKNFVSVAMRPCYTVTDDEEQVNPAKGIYKDENEGGRIDLARHSLDAVDGLGINDAIVCGLIRLSADVDESLNCKARGILEEKMSIHSWDDLAEELCGRIGDGVINKPEDHYNDQMEVLDNLKTRVKEGEVTLRNAPAVARRLSLKISMPKTTSSIYSSHSFYNPRLSRASLFRSSFSIASSSSLRSFSRQSIISKKSSPVTFEIPQSRIPVEDFSSQPGIANDGTIFKPFVPIDWTKAVPEETKKRRKMLSLMKTAYTAATKDTKAKTTPSPTKRRESIKVGHQMNQDSTHTLNTQTVDPNAIISMYEKKEQRRSQTESNMKTRKKSVTKTKMTEECRNEQPSIKTIASMREFIRNNKPFDANAAEDLITEFGRADLESEERCYGAEEKFDFEEEQEGSGISKEQSTRSVNGTLSKDSCIDDFTSCLEKEGEEEVQIDTVTKYNEDEQAEKENEQPQKEKPENEDEQSENLLAKVVTTELKQLKLEESDRNLENFEFETGVKVSDAHGVIDEEKDEKINISEDIPKNKISEDDVKLPLRNVAKPSINVDVYDSAIGTSLYSKTEVSSNDVDYSDAYYEAMTPPPPPTPNTKTFPVDDYSGDNVILADNKSPKSVFVTPNTLFKNAQQYRELKELDKKANEKLNSKFESKEKLWFPRRRKNLLPKLIKYLEQRKQEKQPVETYTPGERLVSGMTLVNRKDNKSRERKWVRACPGRLSTQVYSSNGGESRYGILSLNWVHDPMKKHRENVQAPNFTTQSKNKPLLNRGYIDESDSSWSIDPYVNDKLPRPRAIVSDDKSKTKLPSIIQNQRIVKLRDETRKNRKINTLRQRREENQVFTPKGRKSIDIYLPYCR